MKGLDGPLRRSYDGGIGGENTRITGVYPVSAPARLAQREVAWGKFGSVTWELPPRGYEINFGSHPLAIAEAYCTTHAELPYPHCSELRPAPGLSLAAGGTHW